VTEVGAASEVEVGAEAGEDELPEGPADSGDAAGAGAAAPAPVTARPTVSVVVCGYAQERWDDVSRAMSSLRAQTEQAQEIILVVDHCPDLLRRARRELAGVTVVPNRFARGLAGGRNTGLATARGDVVAFIDDDASADPGWLATLAGRYTDPQVAGVGGLVRPVWEAGRPRWFPPELDWVVGCSYRGMPEASEPVRNLIGANMSFRRAMLEDLHGFSTGLGRVGTFPFGCEETELCLRMSQRYPQAVLLYEPAASVSHRVRRERMGWGYLGWRCFAEGLSKAKVARLAGARRALASERAYLRSTIPHGVSRSLAGAARGHLTGLASALAMVLAVVAASVGYVTGRITGPWAGVVRLPAPVVRAGQAVRRAALSAVVPWAGLALSLALWVQALAATQVGRVNTAGLGLFEVLPRTFWAAAAVLMVSFCLAVVRRSTRWPVLAAHAVALVAVLHATPAILYETLRYSWAWKHVGVIDFITRHGVDFHLGGVLGAYQGWPGFFALNSFLTTASGQGSALSYAGWALPVNDLLWLGPVILIARAFTADQRLVWTAAWLFELGNWVGQDYFSPQAFAYFLYLTVIAICLRWLRAPRASPRPAPAGPAGEAPGRGGWQRVTGRLLPPARTATAGTADSRSPRSAATRWLLVICLLPLMAAIASSHQLTPFMLIAALTLLVVFRQVRPWVLPVAAAAITIGWILYGGLPWLAQNSSQLFEGLGLPWANTSSHLIGETQVPFDQVVVEWGARLLSVAIAALAGIGYLRYRRRHNRRARRAWLRIPLLAAAGIPSVAANSYGGEIIFRVFLFAVPFLAVAAAAAFFPHPRAGRSARTGLALTVTVLGLVTCFCLANYGSDAMNYFSPAEVTASGWLYRNAPARAQLIAANSNFPWAFVHYNWYGYTFLDTPPSLGRTALRTPVATMTSLMEPGHSPPSYLILTRGQAEEAYLTAAWPPGAFDRFTHALLASGRFRVVYRNPDALILQLAPPGFRQLAPDGILELSPSALIHLPAAAAQPPGPASLAGQAARGQPTRHGVLELSPAAVNHLPAPPTRLTGRARARCLIGSRPARFWLDPAGVRLTAVPVPGQTRPLVQECR